jgi:hypothetical protein
MGVVREAEVISDMTSAQGDVAAVLKVAATEPAMLDALEGCVRRLREVQAAKRELARMPPTTLLAGLLDRQIRGGDPS